MQSVFGQSSWDILIFFGLFSVMFLYALLNRRNHLFAIIFSLYSSELIFANFHLLDRFFESENATPGDVFYFRAALYLVLFALIATIIYKKVFGDGGPRFKAWKIVIMVASATGLFANSFLRILPTGGLYEISPLLSRLFIGQNQTMLWLSLPIIAILVILRRP